MENTELRIVPFYGDEIVTFESGSVRWVAMKRIVENMGLNWGSQHAKLLAQKVKFNCRDIATVGADAKAREMFAMPVDKLPLWLATINPNKVAEALRPKLERYQAESAIALHDYWTKGAALRSSQAPVTLDDTFRAAIESVVHREIAVMVPAAIEAAILADPRRSALDYVSVRELLNEAKAEQRKRNRVNRKIGFEMRTLALTSKPAAELRRCPHSNVWLYPRSFAASYMASRGAVLVREHNDDVKGQTVLKLVQTSQPKPPQPKSK